MLQKLYFTPGPSALYFTVEDHLRSALRQQIPSISHRSKQFSILYEETEENLRTLARFGADFHVFFTSSATEIWERMLQSTVLDKSLHLVNGAFSQRFYEVATQLGKSPHLQQAALGKVVVPEEIDEHLVPELVAVTHNETSTGAQQPLEDLLKLRSEYPQALLTVDAVSSFPQVDLPFDTIDSAYFSVQKCFGLPAGLGVWILNKRTIDRALELAPQTHTAYHGIVSFWEKYQKFQTPATPNVLAIYLLNKVITDMLNKGLDRIRMEGRYKAALLYQVMEAQNGIAPFIENPAWRSETVMVGNSGPATTHIIDKLSQKGLVVGTGYGNFKQQHLRIANFPTHSKEQVELLVDSLNEIL